MRHDGINPHTKDQRIAEIGLKPRSLGYGTRYNSGSGRRESVLKEEDEIILVGPTCQEEVSTSNEHGVGPLWHSRHITYENLVYILQTN